MNQWGPGFLISASLRIATDGFCDLEARSLFWQKAKHLPSAPVQRDQEIGLEEF